MAGAQWTPGADERGETDAAPRLYANHLAVEHTLSEMLLDFGQLFPAGGAARPLVTLVTSPVHLRGFHQLIGGAIRRYEAEHGPLPPGRSDPAAYRQ
jgi:hypothetical protein